MPRVLFQDDHLIIVEKPIGILSQEDASGGDSVPKRLRAQGMMVKTIHRLDRATGGVMVYAFTDEAAALLSAEIQDHNRFVKEYLAVISGCPTQPCGEMEDLLYHDVRRNKSYVVNRKRGGVKQAKLAYEVLKTTECDGNTLSLVRVRLYTGRTHQIRVQFASRQMPLVGDSRYGGIRGCPLALWSHHLSFPHPIRNSLIEQYSLPDNQIFPWKLFFNEHHV